MLVERREIFIRKCSLMFAVKVVYWISASCHSICGYLSIRRHSEFVKRSLEDNFFTIKMNNNDFGGESEAWSFVRFISDQLDCFTVSLLLKRFIMTKLEVDHQKTQLGSPRMSVHWNCIVWVLKFYQSNNKIIFESNTIILFVIKKPSHIH